MITILNTNEDGIHLGADETGQLYTGTPVTVTHDEMIVETVVASNGKSFARTTTLPDGTVYAVAEVTEAGFNENNRLVGKTEDECAALWDAEKAIESHGAGGSFNTINWEAK